MLLGIVVLLALVQGGQANSRTDSPETAKTQSGTSLVLARDGKALLPIIISSNAPPETKAVTAELADYLQRMTGANSKFKWVTVRAALWWELWRNFPTPP